MTFEQCVQKAYSIIANRGKYWIEDDEYDRGYAYMEAAGILNEAMEGNWEALNQYDDYSDD